MGAVDLKSPVAAMSFAALYRGTAEPPSWMSRLPTAVDGDRPARIRVRRGASGLAWLAARAARLAVVAAPSALTSGRALPAGLERGLVATRRGWRLDDLVLLAGAVLMLGACALLRHRPAPVTVGQVVRMSKAGARVDEIVARMRASGTVYRLSASHLAHLHDEGVSDAVLDYMQRTYLRAIRRNQFLADADRWAVDPVAIRMAAYLTGGRQSGSGSVMMRRSTGSEFLHGGGVRSGSGWRLPRRRPGAISAREVSSGE